MSAERALSRLLETIPLRPVGFGAATLIVCLSVVLATLFRLSMDPILGGHLFLAPLLVPSVVSALWAGPRAGATALAFSALVAAFASDRAAGGDQPGSSLWIVGAFVLVGLLLLALSAMVRAALTRMHEQRRKLEASERRLALVAGEMEHRVKNTLAVVSALTSQTARGCTDVPQFVRSFAGRLHALGQANDLLIARKIESVQFDELVETVLSAFAPKASGDRGLIVLGGPAMRVSGHDVNGLSLVLHELATNAAKYGALSVNEGRVDLCWRCDPEGRCEVLWSEHDGPHVVPPSREGFGGRLFRQALPDGEAHLEYAPDGVRCRLAFVPEAAARRREMTAA